jgi:hypothetical protein
MMIRMPLLDVCKATLSLLIFPHLTRYIVLAAVKLRRVYGIQYPRDPDVRGDNTLGFTNMFFFFKEEASPLPQKPGNAWRLTEDGSLSAKMLRMGGIRTVDGL